MPLLLTLSAQAPLVDVRAADVDGDGDSELVLASSSGGRTSLQVVDGLGAGPAAPLRLAQEASWWDAGQGLWLLDDEGLLELQTGARTVHARTALPRVGSGSPTRANLVVDLDHDGVAELLIWTADALLVRSLDGGIWGSVGLPGRTELELRSEDGGQVLATTIVPPAVAVADVEGDGHDEILVIADRVLVARPRREGQVQAPESWPLPEGLARPLKTRDQESWTTDAHWADLDGDGRTDLLVHQLHSDGSLAGTESRLLLHLGTGSGLGPAQTVVRDSGVDDVFLVDMDADGDLDVLMPSLSLDMSNLAQAVMVRSVDVELLLMPMDGGELGTARSLRELALPLEGDKAAWSLFEDLSGDGLPDLAVVVGRELSVYLGEGDRVSDKAWLTQSLEAPVEHLWAVDLSGDGAVELVGWAPGDARVSVVQVRDLEQP